MLCVLNNVSVCISENIYVCLNAPFCWMEKVLNVFHFLSDTKKERKAKKIMSN